MDVKGRGHEREHHDRTGGFVDVLLGTIPLLPYPPISSGQINMPSGVHNHKLLAKKQLIKVVCEGGRRESPGTLKARAITEPISVQATQN